MFTTSNGYFDFTGTADTRICTILDMKCYYAARRTFDTTQIVKKCDCKADCKTIGYRAEISQAPYHYFEDDDTIAISQTFDTTG